MLHDNHCVAEIHELAQHLDEAVCVAAVEAYAGFIEDVKAAYEGTTQGCSQVDALTLTTAEAVATTSQRQVAETYV